jgi:penicillin amidase
LAGLIVLTASIWLAAAPQSSRDVSRQAASVTLAHINGTVPVRGLERPVTVLRDHWGVPHIYAENQHDLFFAQGFVAAQDRLFQMELWKRVGQGRLAEILGPGFLKRDIKARLLRYPGPMDAEYASYGPDTREILEAFTAGINEYIRHRNFPDGPGLPVEFRLAGFAPEPWKPEDCLMRMAGFPMTGNAGSELRHAQLVAVMGAERASRLLDLDPQVKLDPAPGVDYSGLTPDLLRDLVGSDSRLEFPPPPESQGSNNWTVSGRLTKSGKPLLANDPHRTIAVPSLRYIVHLVAPGWNVIGAGEPGLPGVAAGHNQQIAWGFTIFGLDQQDLYLETLDPADPLRYKTESGWAEMRVEKETFKVKGQPDAVAELKFTRHGPVLWEDGEHHRAMALRWVGAEPGTAGYLGSLAVDRAANWDEFEQAMARWKVPSENIVYADIGGNIGEHSTGLAPLRKKWTGLLPMAGDAGYEWEGFIPTSELPHSFNPPAGFIATANHKMIPENYRYQVGFEWATADRFRRIQEVLGGASAAGQHLGVVEMKNLQNDVVSLPARVLVRLLRDACGAEASVETAAKAAAPAACAAPAAQLLMKWDAAVTRDSGAAALYEIWLPEVERAVFERLAPESVWKLFEGRWPRTIVLAHLLKADTETFGLEPAAARDRLLLDALAPSVEKLSKLEGPDPAGWQWGKLHQVRFRHPLDRLPGAAKLLDLGPLARPGDGSTVNATSFGPDFEQESGASYREIMDLADWDRSVAVNVPGQSGQPASPHYSDLLPLWAEGQYFPLLYTKPAVEQQTSDRLQLVPERPSQ